MMPWKRLFLFLLLALGSLPIACVRHAATPETSAAPRAAVQPAPGASAGPWRLVWDEEFDKNGLPDPAKWKYEEGFVRNQEAQYYTRARRENCRIENGLLVLEARKEDFKNPGYRPGAKGWREGQEFARYTSGSINTKGIASWRYGRIEVRAKLPDGLGMWPAIWTVGDKGRWPHNGEIDIMEWWGKDPTRIQSTLHYQLQGKHVSSAGRLKAEKPNADFHVFAVEWDQDQMVFFFDDQKVHTFPLAKAQEGDYNPFRQTHGLLLNLALGGTSGGKIDDAKLPQQFLVDYVRIFKKAE